MDSPRYTVIVPMAHFRAAEPVLVSLRETPPPRGGMQVIVAEGAQPSTQRNAALAHARGEIILFLDNDCSIGGGYWNELERVLAQAEVGIVGGPALLRPSATFWEEIFHALLTHTLIVGTVSSRYSARGEFRPATQTDLILCNLAVRRSVFGQIGNLSIKLYPNEENEWLDRAHAAHIGAFYDPALVVFRPQRSTPRQMAVTLLRYGMGRTRQFKVSGWRPTFHQFLPVMVVVTFFVLFKLGLEVEFVVLWLVASAIIAMSCPGLRPGQRLVAGLVAPLIPLTYSVGQVIGWFALFAPAPADPKEIALYTESGAPVI